jgi:hypothetical protein
LEKSTGSNTHDLMMSDDADGKPLGLPTNVIQVPKSGRMLLPLRPLSPATFQNVVKLPACSPRLLAPPEGYTVYAGSKAWHDAWKQQKDV